MLKTYNSEETNSLFNQVSAENTSTPVPKPFLHLVCLNIFFYLIGAIGFYSQSYLLLGWASVTALMLNCLLLIFLYQKETRVSILNFFVFQHIVCFFSLTLFGGGVRSPLLSWTLLGPLLVIIPMQESGRYRWLVLYVVGWLPLFLKAYIPLRFGMEEAAFPPNFSAIAVGLLLLYTLSFLLLGRRTENPNGTETGTVQEENTYLKKQIQILDNRNYRLLKLHQNLQVVEKVNENKTEILTEAALILDSKNKQIQVARDQFIEQSKELEDINKNITNSIRYAQRIQEAIIPDASWVLQHFRDAFIFFRPKDIVSGDFYWFSEVRSVEGKKKILIAADCTGHGVPGAFMTVMGNSLINEVINEMQITQPDRIMEELDRKIIETLSSKDGKAKIHDGMDMVVLSIDDEKRTVQYAAAHNPLFYARRQKLHKIKGSKFAVGSSQYRTRKVFELHTVKAEPGDVFYIFTDGFQDQFGKKAQRKYMTRRFRDFLLSINRLPLHKQGKLVEAEFQHWKEDLPQTDDVLVIGFRM